MHDALSVHVKWGERRLASHLVRRGERLSMSWSGERAAGPLHFTGVTVSLPPRAQGELLRHTGPVPLSELADDEGHCALTLGRDESLRVWRGPLSVEIGRAAAPRPLPLEVWSRLDYRFANITLVAMGVFLLGAIDASLREPPPPPVLARSTVVRVAPKAPPPAVSAPVVTEVPVRTTILPPTKSVVRNQSGGGSAPTAPPGPKATAEGIASVLFAGAGTGAMGLGAELQHALGSVSVSAGTTSGLQLRGGSSGGGGLESVGLGGIRTSGARAYRGSLCAGPGPCKQQVVPEREPMPELETGGLDRELVRAVIRRNVGQVRSCYEERLPSAPSLSGRVVIRFELEPDGSVSRSSVAEDSAGHGLGACIANRARAWQFPKGKVDQRVTIVYPFTFVPRGSR